MSFLENISYKETVLLKDGLKSQGQKQQISLSRYRCESDIYDRYYLRINTKNWEETIKQGYLYFYLNKEKSQSKFVGMSISEEYRNQGLASLLVSSWITLCLDEGFENLGTTPKQRKPHLLYLLKKFDFELKNLDTYQTSTRTVNICKKGNDKSNKYIMFNDKQEEIRFKKSNVMKNDNYEIIDALDDGIEIIDSVVLYSPYYLQDKNKAYQKSLQTYRNHM